MKNKLSLIILCAMISLNPQVSEAKNIFSAKNIFFGIAALAVAGSTASYYSYKKSNEISTVEDLMELKKLKNNKISDLYKDLYSKISGQLGEDVFTNIMEYTWAYGLNIADFNERLEWDSAYSCYCLDKNDIEDGSRQGYYKWRRSFFDNHIHLPDVKFFDKESLSFSDSSVKQKRERLERIKNPGLMPIFYPCISYEFRFEQAAIWKKHFIDGPLAKIRMDLINKLFEQKMLDPYVQIIQELEKSCDCMTCSYCLAHYNWNIKEIDQETWNWIRSSHPEHENYLHRYIEDMKSVASKHNVTHKDLYQCYSII